MKTGESIMRLFLFGIIYSFISLALLIGVLQTVSGTETEADKLKHQIEQIKSSQFDIKTYQNVNPKN